MRRDFSARNLDRWGYIALENLVRYLSTQGGNEMICFGVKSCRGNESSHRGSTKVTQAGRTRKFRSFSLSLLQEGWFEAWIHHNLHKIMGGDRMS